MPGIQTFTSTSYLALPPTTAAFWQYVSSSMITHSLQTVLSASSNPTKRYTISSIITSFAQFQHVIGSIMSSSDDAAAEYFEWFLVNQLNLTPEKINDRWASVREAMKESLGALVEASLKSNRRKNAMLHPAVLEAKEILHEMRVDDSDTGVSVKTGGHSPKPLARRLGKQGFLDVEEYTLRSEFMAFRRDTPGPNGRSTAPTPRPVCPSSILSLRVYHDGLLSVDSRHAFQPGPPRTPVSKLQRDSIQNQLRNKRFPSNLESRGSSISFLERQFAEAMHIMPIRYRDPVEHDLELSRLLDSYDPDYDGRFYSEKSDAISVSVSPKSRAGSVVSIQYPPASPAEFPGKESSVVREQILYSRPVSGAGSEASEVSTIGKVTRKNSQYTWKGDWETEDEDEFYREALKYNPGR
ncbi:hypothetical protein TWF730_010427 [Orbilia blumenaviensis]|uniref:Uncharacterized protein n=1 Tax=Orbilia blumenaviensis TaxID=1796055 RepID=A0AAV9UNM3_9PEZI